MAEVFINVPALKQVTVKSKFHVEGSAVKQVMNNIEQQYPGFKAKLLDQNGKFQNYLVVAGWYASIKDYVLVTHPEDEREDLIKLSIMIISPGG